MSFFDNNDDFDEFFKRQMQAFRQLFSDLHQIGNAPSPQVEDRDGVRTTRFGPFIFGRATYVGPDGKMHTQEWSNLPPEARKEFEEQLRTQGLPFQFPPQPQDRRPSPIPDPLTPDRPFPIPQTQVELKPDDYPIDILDTEDGYTIIFDTPATNVHDVRVDVNGRHLQLWARGDLFRELELPVPVQLISLQFRNGIVEVQLRSKPEEEPKASGESTEQTA